jgi:FMN reductase
VVGNPRPESRTHRLAWTLANALARELKASDPLDVDLAALGAGVLDPRGDAVEAAEHRVRAADLLVVASPTYKASYSGLLKVFLDRFAAGALAGARAVPVLLGGAPNHQLAVDVHLTPLLLELGASVPARGLFVLERDIEAFPAAAATWAREHAGLLA